MAGKTVIISGPAFCGVPALGPFYKSTANATPGVALYDMDGWNNDCAGDVTPSDGRIVKGYDPNTLRLGPVPLTNSRRNYRVWLGSGRAVDFVMEITDSPPKTYEELTALSPSALAALCALVP